MGKGDLTKERKSTCKIFYFFTSGLVRLNMVLFPSANALMQDNRIIHTSNVSSLYLRVSRWSSEWREEKLHVREHGWCEIQRSEST